MRPAETSQRKKEGVKDAETLLRPLPFEADIETNLGESPYRIFDLLFNWTD